MNDQIKGKYVICINNQNADDLQVRKIYETMPDKSAAEDGYVRIVDDSGEDYLYPADYFVPVKLPRLVEKAVFTVPA
ncbi:MAG: hypothetical protein M5U34_11465 [Chloroflexi bacterium]|nr:hypothetical protein [Chloroflexota bacterium]